MHKIKNSFRDINNILTFTFLLLLIIAGFVLRVRNLGYLSFWGDDGHTFVGTLSILKYGFPKLPSGNILWHGIFDYYLKSLPVLIFGAKEFSFRIVSVLSGVGAAITAYFLGKEMANKYVGFLGAAVMTFSTWYIQFSREARYYSDYQFFFILSFLFFYLGFVKERKPFRILAAVFMVLTSLVHGVGITLIFLFIVLIFLKGRNFFKKEIIIPVAAVIFLDALQVINQVFFWKVGRSFYTTSTGTKALIMAYLKLPDPFYFKIINIMFPKCFMSLLQVFLPLLFL
jgi:4-amino-4-deoxy-L-arabinose transferase-like glycosyltransferase